MGPATPGDPPGLPRVIGGRYELTSVIGRGGMGLVYAAVDTRLQREVAVKVLREDLAAVGSVRARFDSEARLAARLAHPNIVAVFDTGDDRGTPYLVMERLPGSTLADELGRGPMPLDAVLDVAAQVLAALGAAHRAGMIHRDIKPGNVLADGMGNWKVGDFGIAKSTDGVDPGLTTTGIVVGTAAYLSPERLAGDPATPGSDLYALGAICYEALSGERLSRSAAWASNRSEAVTGLAELRPDVPPGVIAVLRRATAPEPTNRFVTAADMAAALSAADPAAPTSLLAPAAATQMMPAAALPLADTVVVPPPGPPVPPPTGRRAWLIALLIALVAAGAAVGIALALTGTNSSGGKAPTTPATTATSVTTTPATTSPAVSPATTAAPTTPPATTVPPTTAPTTVPSTSATTTNAPTTATTRPSRTTLSTSTASSRSSS